MISIDPGAMAKPVPANVLHLQAKVEEAVAGQKGSEPQILQALHSSLKSDGRGEESRCVQICVCDMNTGPAETLRVRSVPASQREQEMVKPRVFTYQQCGSPLAGLRRSMSFFESGLRCDFDV